MTRDRQIDELLRKVPDGAKRKVVAFLRELARKRTTRPTERRPGDARNSVADRSFGMIPADAVTVRQVLSEDLYELE